MSALLADQGIGPPRTVTSTEFTDGSPLPERFAAKPEVYPHPFSNHTHYPMKPTRLSSIATILVCLNLPLAAQSTYTAGTGNWSTAASWSPAGVPAADADIILSNGSANGGTLTLDGTTSRTIGSYTHGTNGTRTAGFNLQTNANTLTLQGGLTANGNFTGVGLRMRGNYVVSSAQTWQIAGGLGTVTSDHGVAIQEISGGNRGTLALDGTLTKTGSGQLLLIGMTLEGAGDLVVEEGALKLNAGANLELRATGPGKFILNNASSLMISKNSGTFGDSVTFNRAFQMNGTANIVTGGNGTAGPWTIHSPIEWTGSHTVNLNNSVRSGTPAMNYEFAGVMSGSGSLTKLGAGQLAFTGATSNTLDGLVTVSAGQLRLAKTGGSTAIAGDLLITGGSVLMAAPNQIADTAHVTVTGGQFIDTAGHADTIASLTISSGATSSVSNITVTGATTITNGIHDVNSGQSFTTHSLAISNNGAIRPGANSGGPNVVNVGAGGLTLDSGRVIFGSAGSTPTAQLNLAGDLLSNGTSLLTAPNYNGPRITDLQGAARSFTIESGSLDIQTTVQNGSLVKSGAGLLRLSRAGSTADVSITEGPAQIAGPIDAANFSMSGGSLLMDIGGAAPSKITTTGNVTVSGGTIEITSLNGLPPVGSLELIRYGGNLVGTPVINLSATLLASRLQPVVDSGDGSDDAVTITTSGEPLSLAWHGGAGNLWDLKNTSNFNGGAQTYFELDSVLFDDTGINASIQLDATVFPAEVTFDHNTTVPVYTLSGSGGISGIGKLVKWGTGTSIIATNNTYTGVTEINEGILRVGTGGATGSLGSGALQIAADGTLEYARSGLVVLSNTISGAGTFLQSGPGTLVVATNNPSFFGAVSITGGILQLGTGAAEGTLGTATIDIAAGATLAVRRAGIQAVPNPLSGDGSATVAEGNTIFSGSNTHTGGFTVTDGGVLRITSDASLGAEPAVLTSNAIRLTNGGLKNQNSDPVTDPLRGITISGEAYFTAGWTRTLTVTGPITGSGDVFINHDSGRVILTHEGSDWTGVLTLGASKPGFSGTTGGNLEIASVSNGGVASPLGAASADPANIVFNGGRLIYTGDTESTNRGFTLQGTGTIDVASSSLEFSGVVTGSGSLTKAGAGTLILSGDNDFAGTKTLAGGTVKLASPSGLGSTAANGTFTGTTSVLELATDVSVNPYSFTIGVGNSATILSGVATPGPGINHTLGNLVLSSVTLNVGASLDVTEGNPRVSFAGLNLSAGSSGTTTLNPTTADITLGTAAILSNAANKTLTLGGTSLDNHVTGVISDGLATFLLRKENTSVWTVSGDNTFTGTVVVNNGVMVIDHTNALGASNKTVTIAGDASNNRIPELRLSGGISPTVSILNLSGNGTAATGVLRNLSGNNTVTATTQVNLASGNGNTTLYSDSGTLTLNSPLIQASITSRTLTLAGPGDGVINGSVANGSTINLPVIKTGTGTWALNGNHTYTGATTVQQGVLSLGQAALDDASTVNIAADAVLDLNFAGTDVIAALNLGGNSVGPGTYNSSHPLYGSYFTGTGSLRIPGEETPFEEWMSTNYPSLVGPAAEAGADPDHDGVPNLLEFIINGDPTSASARGVSVIRTADTNATAGDELILVVAMRKNAVFTADGTGQAQQAVVDGVVCRVEGSANLATFTAPVEALALPLPAELTAGLPALAPSDAWEYRAFRLKDSDGLPNKGFLRLTVAPETP